MSKVSISQAAKLAGISRSYLYRKYINTGNISILVEDDKKLIDISELIRVFGELHVDSEHGVDSKQYDTPSNSSSLQDKDRLIAHLEHELLELKADARQREEWLKQQIDELRQQQSNLLENKLGSSKQKRKKFLGIF